MGVSRVGALPGTCDERRRSAGIEDPDKQVSILNDYETMTGCRSGGRCGKENDGRE